MKSLLFLLIFPILSLGQSIKSNRNIGIMLAKTPETSCGLKNTTNYFFNGLVNYNFKDYKTTQELLK